MRISDWSSDVCSSDLWPTSGTPGKVISTPQTSHLAVSSKYLTLVSPKCAWLRCTSRRLCGQSAMGAPFRKASAGDRGALFPAPLLSPRSEEHTSELQSLMRISYAVFCLKKKNNTQRPT